MSVVVKSFVKQFVAVIKGDDAAAQAEKVFRRVNAELKSQIPALDGDTVRLEDNLENAKTNLTSAKINHGKPFQEDGSYTKNLLNAKNDVTLAEEALKKHLLKIEFLKDTLKELETEVKE